RFSSWKAQDLARVDPAQVRVRLSVNDGFEIDVEKAKLEISLTDATGTRHQARLPLDLLLSKHETRPGGWLSPDVPVNTLVLALTPAGARQLTELQQVILAGEPRKFALN